jgi:hypothetical protein
MELQPLVGIAGAGALWILYLLVALSIGQVTLMVERVVVFARSRGRRREIEGALARGVAAGDLAELRGLVSRDRSAAAAVLRAGLARADSVEAAQVSMQGALTSERERLERGLASGRFENATRFTRAIASAAYETPWHESRLALSVLTARNSVEVGEMRHLRLGTAGVAARTDHRIGLSRRTDLHAGAGTVTGPRPGSATARSVAGPYGASGGSVWRSSSAQECAASTRAAPRSPRAPPWLPRRPIEQPASATPSSAFSGSFISDRSQAQSPLTSIGGLMFTSPLQITRATALLSVGLSALLVSPVAVRAAGDHHAGSQDPVLVEPAGSADDATVGDDRFRRSDTIMWALSGVVILHLADHVIRDNHSGWPCQKQVTPLTPALTIPPLYIGGYLLDMGPAYFTTLSAVGSALVLFTHWIPGVAAEPPSDIHDPWVDGSNLLGVESPGMGRTAQAVSVLLTVGAFAHLGSSILDGINHGFTWRRRKPSRGLGLTLMPTPDGAAAQLDLRF